MGILGDCGKLGLLKPEGMIVKLIRTMGGIAKILSGILLWGVMFRCAIRNAEK